MKFLTFRPKTKLKHQAKFIFTITVIMTVLIYVIMKDKEFKKDSEGTVKIY